jgi:hypothetical protein
MVRNLLVDQYLWKCKSLYLAHAFPNAADASSLIALQELRALAKEFIAGQGISKFSGFLREYQYLVDLFTAHLIIESENADEDLEKECLDTIRRYSETPLNPVLAEQESQWLKRFEGS